MKDISKLKPTFKLSASEIGRATLNWQMQSNDYQKDIRFGQHYCNFFKLCRLEGVNKEFEEVLWQTDDPVEVLMLLGLVTDWEN